MQGKVLWLIALAAAACGTATCKKLPAGMISCSRDDPQLNECALRSGQQVLSQVVRGYPDYHMPSLDPLHVTHLAVDDPQGSGSRVALSLTMRDVDIIGLNSARLNTIDLTDENHWSWSVSVPKLNLIGSYNISGRVLILPIRGNGAMNITLDDLECTYSVTVERVLRGKNKVEHYNATDSNVVFTVSRAHYQLQNLFDGEPQLSNQMNLFLNENWNVFIEELGPAVGEAINVVLRHSLNNMARQVPAHEVFVSTV